MSNNHKMTIDAVRAALSAPRLRTYEAAVSMQSDADPAALSLYAWNAEVSGALLAPLHICEVVIRNAVAEALEAVYGPRWPWETSFKRSLPNTPKGYNACIDLQRASHAAPSVGKVIPELKFVFWQKMFTKRHDIRIWNSHLKRVMPNLNRTKSVAELRECIYNDLERIRRLRNRIAHHEPIFKQPLSDHYHTVQTLITHRCKITAAWLANNQKVTSVIASKPNF